MRGLFFVMGTLLPERSGWNIDPVSLTISACIHPDWWHDTRITCQTLKRGRGTPAGGGRSLFHVASNWRDLEWLRDTSRKTNALGTRGRAAVIVRAQPVSFEDIIWLDRDRRNVLASVLGGVLGCSRGWMKSFLLRKALRC